MTEKHKLHVVIRDFIVRDRPEILDIEAASFEHHWTAGDFVGLAKVKDTLMLTAESGSSVMGYAIYKNYEDKIYVYRMAVHPDHTREEVGTQIISRFKAKMAMGRKTSIVIHLRESNLDAQLFFKAMGFRCNGISDQHFQENREDGYRMVYQLGDGR